MNFSTMRALLVALLIFPASLPANGAPVPRAENLGDTTPSTQPLPLAIANLDQRISTDTEPTAAPTRPTTDTKQQLGKISDAMDGYGSSARCWSISTPSATARSTS